MLFEIEGILADTADARRAALRRSLADDGIAVGEATLARCADGRTASDAVALAATEVAAGLDATALELAALRAERAFSTWLAKGVVLLPGARETLASLAGRVRLAAVTRASRRDAELLLSMAGVGDVVEFVIAAEDASPPKPDAAPYRRALERLARRGPVHADRIAALEDGHVGIAAARAAGLRCIAVGALPAHEAMEADALVPSLDGLTPADLDALATAGAGGRR